MKPLKIHYLQHVAFEGPGYIAQWAQEKGHTLTATHLYKGEDFPNTDALDWLIIMGGPMSANDTDTISWLQLEKDFIAKAIAAGKKIIGICLGAQLITSVLGGKVYPNDQKEIGWFPVYNPTGKNNFILDSNEAFTAFHWHGETFSLPDNAELLVSSEGCINQAYSIGNHILGLQFHPEVTNETISQMLTFGKEELVNGKYIQNEEYIRSNAHLAIEGNNRMQRILNYFEAQ
jgi:GMP synthase-like glutamine amidotransferase